MSNKIEEEIERVVQSVNEWDDRTSPDDYPEHLLITSEELADILRNFAEVVVPSPSPREVGLSEIKRYDLEQKTAGLETYHEMVECRDGDWVRFDDVAAVVATLERR